MKTFLLSFFCLLVALWGCRQNGNISEDFSKKQLAGTWKVTCKVKNESKDLGTIVTFSDTGEWSSINKNDINKKNSIKNGNFYVQGKKLIMTRAGIQKENKGEWTINNINLLEFKTNRINDPDHFLCGQSIYMERVK